MDFGATQAGRVKTTGEADGSKALGVYVRRADEAHRPVRKRPAIDWIQGEQRHISVPFILLDALKGCLDFIEGAFQNLGKAPGIE
ncbi:hypothetical protein D3C71_1091430 [compost metagenome]